jgi:hypothetical protein
MQESAVKIPPETIVGESEKQGYLTTDIYDLNSLKVISSPPVLKYKIRTNTIFPNSLTTKVTVASLKKMSVSESANFSWPIRYINFLPEGEQEILTRKKMVIKVSNR